MSPHYIAQKRGDDYVLVRVDPVAHMSRVVAGAAGLTFLAKGLSRAGLTAIVGCALGAGLIYHAITGRDPRDMVSPKSRAKHGSDKDSPSFPGDATSKQLPADELEEASMESFPASDPPASMHGEK